jgi:hypothetical protein
MLRHFQRRRYESVRVDQTVKEANFVESFCGETKTERHFHGDGVWQIGEVAVVLAAQ